MLDFPEVLPTDLLGVELRRLLPGTAEVAAVEKMVPEAEKAATFYYFTRKPLPLEEFLRAPGRITYAVYRGEEPLACTSVYDVEGDRVTLGFTWMAPSARGTGVNGAMKKALFEALRSAGMREAWFRADVDNVVSLRSMEKAGAERMHIEDAPRVYPDRVSQSVFFRKKLSTGG